MSHEIHLRRALALAEAHSKDGRHGPFGAVVVLDGSVVGEGWNQVVEGRDPTAHAEVMAIREAGRNLGTHDLSGAILYSSCEPCPMCLAAIYWARIDEIVYAASAEEAAGAGFDDARILEELKKPPEERKAKTTRLLEEEGRRIFRQWLENPKRVPY